MAFNYIGWELLVPRNEPGRGSGGEMLVPTRPHSNTTHATPVTALGGCAAQPENMALCDQPCPASITYPTMDMDCLEYKPRHL
jgi:hypothetical protein